MDIVNEITAKVMGEILAKGMSLSEVDLSKSVDSEAVKALEKIKTVLSEEQGKEQKLESVRKIVNEYKTD